MDWLSSHWQWVFMAIVALALGPLAISNLLGALAGLFGALEWATETRRKRARLIATYAVVVALGAMVLISANT